MIVSGVDIKKLEQECDDCGSQIIYNCARCGAPQCCPKCCEKTTYEAMMQWLITGDCRR